MLTRPEVIEVEEAPLASLFYAEAGEADNQRLGEDMVGIDAGALDVDSAAHRMSARCGLGRFDGVFRAPVARGDDQRVAVLSAEELESIHRLRIHLTGAGLVTGHLAVAEVGPSVIGPGLEPVVQGMEGAALVGTLGLHYFFFDLGLVLRFAFRAAAWAAFLPAAV